MGSVLKYNYSERNLEMFLRLNSCLRWLDSDPKLLQPRGGNSKNFWILRFCFKQFLIIDRGIAVDRSSIVCSDAAIALQTTAVPYSTSSAEDAAIRNPDNQLSK